MSDVNPEMGFVLNCDVLIVGGGFSGIASLYRARKLGLNAKLFEAGADFGGVWHWNRYPGARVDSEFPFYQLNIPEAYRSWHFSERFPGAEELRRYMAHLDKALDLSKDTLFQARVVDAQYDTLESKWKVKTSAGHTATCKYLILATGLLHRTYSPDFLGLEDYKGAVHHSGSWPENLSCRGKKVAVIGAGATAVQIVQELAKETASSGGSLTVFIRRPSTCIPMRQRPISKEEQDAWKAYFARLFQEGRKSRAGFPFKLPGKGVYDVSDEEREAYLEEIWGRGAFNFAMANYNNVATNLAANRAVYDFWAKKTRARITDPLKRDIMAPLEPLYPIGTKRSPLEQDYYECLDMKHVEIVNMNSTPLKTFTDKGMLLDGQTEREFDVIVLATGFDSFTGSLFSMGLKNKDGVDIKDLWKEGVRTYLGISISGFPNAFLIYSPQSPTALSNGPTILECQSDFVFDIIGRLESENVTSIDATHTAEDEWKELIDAGSKNTLFSLTNSWWTGSNVPGKKAEWLSFNGGIDQYEVICRDKLDGWKGFHIISA